MLLPLYIILAFLSSYSYKSSNYFNRSLNSNEIIGNAANYEDLLIDEKDFIKDVVIPSKVITDSYLRVFMVFDESIDDKVFAFNPSLKPEKDLRGSNFDIIVIDELSRKKRDSIRREYMSTLNTVFNVRIDSVDYDSEFIFTASKKKQKGFETYVGIKNLNEGKHLLNLMRKRIRKKDTQTIYVKRIPFWYYPN